MEVQELNKLKNKIMKKGKNNMRILDKLNLKDITPYIKYGEYYINPNFINFISYDDMLNCYYIVVAQRKILLNKINNYSELQEFLNYITK